MDCGSSSVDDHHFSIETLPKVATSPTSTSNTDHDLHQENIESRQSSVLLEKIAFIDNVNNQEPSNEELKINCSEKFPINNLKISNLEEETSVEHIAKEIQEMNSCLNGIDDNAPQSISISSNSGENAYSTIISDKTSENVLNELGSGDPSLHLLSTSNLTISSNVDSAHKTPGADQDQEKDAKVSYFGNYIYNLCFILLTAEVMYTLKVFHSLIKGIG